MTGRLGAMPAGLVAGIALGFILSSPGTPMRLIGLLLSLTVIGAGLLVGVRKMRDRHRDSCSACIVAALACCAGLLLSHAAVDRRLARQVPTEWHGQDVLLSGYIVDRPRQSDRLTRFDLAVTAIQWPDGRRPIAELAAVQRVRLYWYGRAPSLKTGEGWQLPVRLRSLRSLANPGSADRSRWTFLQGIDARGSVRLSVAMPQRLATPPGAGQPLPDRLAGKLQNLRALLADRVATLPAAGAHHGIVQALSIGITDTIEQDVRQLFRDTGTAHLLAVSGLHIGLAWWFGQRLFSLLWYALAMMLRNRLPSRDAVADTAALLVASAYAALAGFALPTRRALLMLVVVVLARRLQRPLAAFTAVFGALALLLLGEPLLLADAGFWLSFTAVFTLVYLGSGRRRRLPPSGPMGLLLGARAALGVHAALGVVLLPVSAYFFSTASLIAPVANFLVVPLFSLLLVPLSLLIVVCLPVFPALASALLGVAETVLARVVPLLHTLADWRFAAVPVQVSGALSLVLSLVALACLFLPRGVRMRWLVVPLCLPLLSANLVSRDARGLEVHVLDVGQGLAVLMHTARHTVLFDTGGFAGPDSTMFERVVLPALAAQGRRRIDLLILSHAHSDHAAGAALAQRRFPDMEVLASVPADAASQPCQAGDYREFDQVRFAFLHPGARDRGSENERSCVLLVQFGASRVLLTGDIEAAAERALVRRVGDPLSVDILLAPHHGSDSSSSEPFVNTFPAAHVVYAASASNRFGFPHARVQMRYKLSGAESYRTGEDGAISFWLGPTGLSRPPRRFRFSGRRFWQDRTSTEPTASVDAPPARAREALPGG